MAAKKSGRKINLETGKKSMLSISRDEWVKAMEDQKRATVIVGDIGFDIMLAGIIEGTFPQRTKDVQKLMKSINMIQKARLAYILRLIDKVVLEDLEQINEIRNKFGHSFEASFAYTKVLKFVRKLSTAKGQEVTEKNSYKFYESVAIKCVEHIMAVFDEQQKKKPRRIYSVV